MILVQLFGLWVKVLHFWCKSCILGATLVMGVGQAGGGRVGGGRRLVGRFIEQHRGDDIQQPLCEFDLGAYRRKSRGSRRG